MYFRYLDLILKIWQWMLGIGLREAPIVKVTWQVCDSTSSTFKQQNADFFY